MLSRYDLQQISLIKERIELFLQNKMDLFDFVHDLIGLLDVLENVPDLWKNKFRAKINILEMIWECIEEDLISKWKGNYKEDIFNSVSELKEMVISIMEEYLKEHDLNIKESAIQAQDHWLICPICDEAWESNIHYAMIICPKCSNVLHNPLK